MNGVVNGLFLLAEVAGGLGYEDVESVSAEDMGMEVKPYAHNYKITNKETKNDV